MRNQIVILAAGKGTRMGNSKVPKVLVMLKNKPLILHLLHELEKINQLIKPVVVVGYGAGQVKGVLGDDYLYAFQSKQLGTANALWAAKSQVRAENILVLYGDMPFIKAESLRALIGPHFKEKSILSMLTATVPNFENEFKPLENYGRIIRSNNVGNGRDRSLPTGQIIKVVEFKDAAPSQREIKEVCPGIFMFNTKWLWDNISKIQNRNAQGEYYLTDFVAVAAAQGININSLPIDPKEVLGVNSGEDLAIAEEMLQKATE